MQPLNPLSSFIGNGSKLTRARLLEFVTKNSTFTSGELETVLPCSRQQMYNIRNQLEDCGYITGDDELRLTDDGQSRVLEVYNGLANKLSPWLVLQNDISYDDARESAVSLINDAFNLDVELNDYAASIDGEPEHAYKILTMMRDTESVDETYHRTDVVFAEALPVTHDNFHDPSDEALVILRDWDYHIDIGHSEDNPRDLFLNKGQREYLKREGYVTDCSWHGAYTRCRVTDVPDVGLTQDELDFDGPNPEVTAWIDGRDEFTLDEAPFGRREAEAHPMIYESEHLFEDTWRVVRDVRDEVPDYDIDDAKSWIENEDVFSINDAPFGEGIANALCDDGLIGQVLETPPTYKAR